VAKRERVQKEKAAPGERKTEEHVEPKTEDAEAAALKAETDALLDEIDGLLEEQEVLVNFRQKGGQ